MMEDKLLFHNKTDLFNPSDLKVEIKNTTVGLLVELLEANMIDMQPEFQRNRSLWTKKEKCELIESIALGLPIPSFYLYLDAVRKKYIIIDGLQRLCTLQEFFVDKSLRLKNLTLRIDFNDKNYDALDFFEASTLKMFSVTTNILSGRIETSAISEIFRRVNSQGTQLTAAEVRNALYQGKSTKLIGEMVHLPMFKHLISKNMKVERMADREYATRYLAFLLGDFASYAGNMNRFLGDAMKFVNCLNDDQILGLKKQFENTLNACFQIFGEDAFRIPKTRDNERLHPVSRAVFEMLTVSLSKVSQCSINKIYGNRNAFIKEYEKMFCDIKMKSAFTSNMASVSNVSYRFKMMNELILNYIK